MPSTSSSAPADPDRPRRGRLALLAAVVVAAVAGVTVWAVTSGSSPRPVSSARLAAPPTAAPSSPTTGAPGVAAPAFSAGTLGGGRVSLRQLAGRPVLVNFWASWCHPCRQEFPLFRSVLAKYRGRGLVIVGVSFEDIPGDARAFVAQEHADWTFARDDDGSIAAAYGVRPVPETFFVRRDGTLAGRLFGITSAHQLDATVQAILGP